MSQNSSADEYFDAGEPNAYRSRTMNWDHLRWPTMADILAQERREARDRYETQRDFLERRREVRPVYAWRAPKNPWIYCADCGFRFQRNQYALSATHCNQCVFTFEDLDELFTFNDEDDIDPMFIFDD